MTKEEILKSRKIAMKNKIRENGFLLPLSFKVASKNALNKNMKETKVIPHRKGAVDGKKYMVGPVITRAKNTTNLSPRCTFTVRNNPNRNNSMNSGMRNPIGTVLP